MRTDTRDRIQRYVEDKGRARPNDLVRKFGISQSMVQRHVKRLVSEGKLLRAGEPPMVFYVPKKKLVSVPEVRLEDELVGFLEKRYLYVSPEGELLHGVSGFWQWVMSTKQEGRFKQLAKRYRQIRQEADKSVTGGGWIEATRKLKSTYDEVYMERLLYRDFYSLPEFGKTRLGSLVLHAKVSQDKGLIGVVVGEIEEVVGRIVEEYEVEAVGFVPHSVPRRVSFLKEVKRGLGVNLPELVIVKAYTGDVMVAQKSLGKLGERVQNARETMFFRDVEVDYDRVLLIDDAVGSGATMNELAKKLRLELGVKQVIGFAVVGSIKGFEVIREI